MENEQTLMCDQCKAELKKLNANFGYLNHSFQAEVLRCMKCGQVYLPEDFVRGRMKQVELMMEEK